MNVSQMSMETKATRAAALKAQIEELQAQFDELRASLIDDLKTQGVKSATFGDIKVSYSTATYYSYADDAVAFLESKGLTQCVEKKVKTATVNACLKAGVLSEKELNEHRTGTPRDNFTVKAS